MQTTDGSSPRRKGWLRAGHRAARWRPPSLDGRRREQPRSFLRTCDLSSSPAASALACRQPGPASLLAAPGNIVCSHLPHLLICNKSYKARKNKNFLKGDLKVDLGFPGHLSGGLWSPRLRRPRGSQRPRWAVPPPLPRSPHAGPALPLPHRLTGKVLFPAQPALTTRS